MTGERARSAAAHRRSPLIAGSMQAGVAEGNEKKAPFPARSETHQERKTLSLRELIGSGLAAALGVQSGKNRERDFNNGKASSFIALGVVFTAIFIGSVLTIVNLVLSGR